MATGIRTDFSEVKRLRANIGTIKSRLRDEKYIARLLAMAKADLVNRTKKTGRGVNLLKMKGYSPAYKNRRRALGLPTNKRTLSVTGQMLDAVETKVNSPLKGVIRVKATIHRKSPTRSKSGRRKRRKRGAGSTSITNRQLALIHQHSGAGVWFGIDSKSDARNRAMALQMLLEIIQGGLGQRRARPIGSAGTR